MHHLDPTRHANTAPIHPRDGGRLRRWSKWLWPAPRDQTLSSLTTRFLSPPSIQITSRRKSGRMAAQIRVQSTYFQGSALWQVKMCRTERRKSGLCLCSKSVFPFPPHRVDATGGNPERWENKSRSKSGGKCLGCRPLEISSTSKVGDLELATRKSGQ